MKMDRCVQFDQLEGKKSHCEAIKLPLLCLFFAKQVRTYPRYFSRLCRICVFAICQVTPEIPEKNTIGRFSNVNVLFLRVVEFCPPGRSEPDNFNHNDLFPCSGFLALMVMSPLALTMWKLFASHLQRRVSFILLNIKAGPARGVYHAKQCHVAAGVDNVKIICFTPPAPGLEGS